MDKPSKGPWRAWNTPTDLDPNIVIEAEAGMVAQTLGGNDNANARLIMAAGTTATICADKGFDGIASIEVLPDLLAALEGILRSAKDLPSHGEAWDSKLVFAEKTLAAARGRAAGMKEN